MHVEAVIRVVVIVAVLVIVGRPIAAASERQEVHAQCVRQREDPAVAAQGLERSSEERLQAVADPDDQVGP